MSLVVKLTLSFRDAGAATVPTKQPPTVNTGLPCLDRGGPGLGSGASSLFLRLVGCQPSVSARRLAIPGEGLYTKTQPCPANFSGLAKVHGNDLMTQSCQGPRSCACNTPALKLFVYTGAASVCVTRRREDVSSSYLYAPQYGAESGNVSQNAPQRLQVATS